MSGYIVTWDVDSRDSSLCAKLRRYVFGYSTQVDGRTYRHPGFVEKPGVRYLGQSVLFVTTERHTELRSFLHRLGISHVVLLASVGPTIAC